MIEIGTKVRFWDSFGKLRENGTVEDSYFDSDGKRLYDVRHLESDSLFQRREERLIPVPELAPCAGCGKAEYLGQSVRNWCQDCLPNQTIHDLVERRDSLNAEHTKRVHDRLKYDPEKPVLGEGMEKWVEKAKESEVIVWRTNADGDRLYLTGITWSVNWSLVRKNARHFAHENAAYSYMAGRVAPSILERVEYEEVG